MYKHILYFWMVASWVFLIYFFALLVLWCALVLTTLYCALLNEIGMHPFLVHIADFGLCAFLDWAFSLPLYLSLLLIITIYWQRHPNFSFTALFKSPIKIPSWVWNSASDFSLLDALVTIFGLAVLFFLTIWHFA